ncbi:S41 family peptidase [Arcticibacter eurypsychrophilus]|uniref:S41 family peptidase n=1 Tax=Arcticibacter eurypsychrophilus TaxID=1434752 RepID=UPI00084E00D8|nr:S41 family peptidase [Arcticibacter eurypsychrophilus]
MWNRLCTSKKFFIPWLLFILIFSFTQSSCKKDNTEPDYPSGSNQYINNWVMDSMKVYYYWNNALPSKSNLDQEPLDFFSSIKNTDDRFSRLTNPSYRESYYPSLVHTFGFDLVVYEESSSTIKTALVLVVPGTQAQVVGLQRGSIIKSINGTQPLASNIANLVESAIAKRSITLDIEGKSTVTLGATLISENPVYLYKVFKNGGKPTAYLFYNSFEGRSKFDLQDAFAFFKNANATELIIDLRYNPGGDIGMSAALAAVLSNVNQDDIFVEYKGNKNAGTRREAFEKTISKISPGYSFSFQELEAMRLPISRVFILTGTHTASAAEFLIKSLRPYVTVVQVGNTTLGKDMASFTISDGNTGKNNNWSIEPMIFKLYNSKSEGDYPSGLVPDIPANEFSETLVPFGDLSDPLIKSALSRINGTAEAKSFTNQVPTRILYDSREAIDKNSGQVNINRLP